ncbi:MAG: hypothetical protein ACFFAH_08480 [Promethearchaeota archaeon]
MIINKASIALFYYNFIEKSKEKDNYQVIASFLDQIAHFIKFGLKDDLGIIMMSNYFYSFYIHKNSNLLSIFKCDKNYYDNPKIIKRSLDVIAKKIMDAFFLKFKDNIENFDGNISRFNSFRETIADIFSSNRD